MVLNNTYYILRHGEALSNEKNLNSSWPEQFKNPLTKKGIKQITEVVQRLKKVKVDFIFASDLLRTKQTAEMVGKALKIKPQFDSRLREIDFGNLNAKPIEELLYMSFVPYTTSKQFPKGETYQDVLTRVKKFFNEINEKYKGKTIVIVSHQCPLWVLETAVHGLTFKKALKIPKNHRIRRGELKKLASHV